MIAVFRPGRLSGTVSAPPSKSLSHRYLIGAALSGQVCTLSGISGSEDILATVDCLTALGARISVAGDRVTVDPRGFMQADSPALNARESGSTLRFFLPLALCLGKPVTIRGSERLFERPLDVYESLCRENGFLFRKERNSVTVCGKLAPVSFSVRGDVSSQFITGLIFALVHLGGEAEISILPPFESRSYINLTLSALSAYGADVKYDGDYRIRIAPAALHGCTASIEGDCSNAAFLDAFNLTGSSVRIDNLNPESLQGDRVYAGFFRQIAGGAPVIDLSDCPDLGPVLFALAALKNGAVFTGTDRLRAKESDRIAAMQQELEKLGGGLIAGENTVTVPAQQLRTTDAVLDGHNDHRIVMALSVILSRLGGSISGAEAVKKSYPLFFDDIRRLGAKVELT